MAEPKPFFIYDVSNNNPDTHVTSLCFAFDSKILLIGTSESLLHVYSTKTHRKIRTLDLKDDKSDQENSILLAETLQDDKLMLSHLRNSSVALWNVTFTPTTNIEFDKIWQLPFPTLTFCPATVFKNWILAPVLDGNQLQLFSLDDGKPLGKFWQPEGQPLAGKNIKFGAVMQTLGVVKWSKNFIFAGYENGEIIGWEVSDDLCSLKKAVHILVSQDAILSLKCTSDGDIWLVGTAGCGLSVYRWASETSFELQNTIVFAQPGCSDIFIRADEKLVVTGGWDAKGRLYELKRQKAKLLPLAILRHHSHTINVVSCSGLFKKGSNIISLGSKDGRVSLWRLY